MSTRNSGVETDANDQVAEKEIFCAPLPNEQDDNDSGGEISHILDSMVKEEHKRLRHCHAQRRYRARKLHKRIVALQRSLVLLQNYRDVLQETVYLRYENAMYERRISELQKEPPCFFNSMNSIME